MPGGKQRSRSPTSFPVALFSKQAQFPTGLLSKVAEGVRIELGVSPDLGFKASAPPRCLPLQKVPSADDGRVELQTLAGPHCFPSRLRSTPDSTIQE